MSKANFIMPKRSGKGSGCLIIFGLPFFAAGCTMLWFLFLSPFLQSVHSENWTKTPCTILKSELAVNSGGDGNTYSPLIHYSYQFNGINYESSQVDFAGHTSSSDREGEEAYVRDFPVNSQRACYVNPDSPGEAVLVKDWGRGVFKWIAIPFGGVFAAIGFGIMLFGASPWIFRKKNSVNRGSEAILQPTGQRLGKLGVMLFINIFWNGIVSIFIIFWLSGLIRGTAEGFMEKWGLGLFLTPFIAVGSFLAWQLIKELKNFIAPKVTITVKQGLEWRCGETFDLKWSIPYSSEINCLKLDFICQESATYSQGTSTSTDTEIVATVPITENKPVNFEGNCKFSVPEGLMPTLESANNRISWAIRVRTEGSGPDADDQYDVNLLQSRI